MECHDKFFKNVRKQIFLAKKLAKQCNYCCEEARNQHDSKQFKYYFDLKHRFEVLCKKFEENAIFETLILKNKHDMSKKLDLHGLKRREALKVLKMLIEELQSKRKQMPKIYTIITGRGNHSKDGPVLRPAVENFLREFGVKYEEINAQGGFKLYIS
jgi:DNA-nicking Smr family endonuclease